MSDLMLDVGLANELKLSFREARGSDGSEWTAGDVKSLANPTVLGGVLDLVRGRADIVLKKVEDAKKVVVPLVLVLVKTFRVTAVTGNKTSDCFTNKSRYYYRDPNLDKDLPEDQPEQPDSGFSVYRPERSATFKQVVESYLGIEGDIQVLSQELKRRGCITTLPTVETLVERQELGQDVGLRTDGWANFFFVENKNGSVSVVSALRIGRRWRVRVFPLACGFVWDADDRFFFRNSDTVSL